MLEELRQVVPHARRRRLRVLVHAAQRGVEAQPFEPVAARVRPGPRRPGFPDDGQEELDGRLVRLEALVRTADRTGIEMEALTAVAVAGLTVVDMVKAVDPGATIESVRVERKAGGAGGEWRRPT